MNARHSSQAHYEIVVRGVLGPEWSTWFADMTITERPGGQTLLSGRLPDQAALQGVLMHILDLNLELVGVRRLAECPRGADGEAPAESGTDEPPGPGRSERASR